MAGGGLIWEILNILEYFPVAKKPEILKDDRFACYFHVFSGIRWFSSIVLYRSIRDQKSLSVRKFICRLIDGKGASNSSTQQLSLPWETTHLGGPCLNQSPTTKNAWQTNQVNSDSDPWTACVSWLVRNGGCFGSWGVETRGKFVKNAWFVRMELVNKKRGRS